MNIEVNHSSDDDDDDDDEFDNGYHYTHGGNRIDIFTPVRGRQQSLVRDFTPTSSRSMSSGEAPASSQFFAQQQRQQQQQQQQEQPNRHWFGAGHRSKTKNGNKNDGNDNNDDDPIDASFGDDSVLPSAQDTSWLGARLSPIPRSSDDGNPDDEDKTPSRETNESARDTASAVSPESTIFFKGPNDEMDDPSEVEQESNLRHERDDNDNDNLLGFASQGSFGGRNTNITTNTTTNNNHPEASSEAWHRRPRLSLWRQALPGGGTTQPTTFEADDWRHRHQHPRPRRHRRRRRHLKTPCPSPSSWSDAHPVPAGTALFLLVVGIHDAFLSYLETRNGIESSVSRAWTLPWIGPSERSLLRFGAFCPRRMLVLSAGGGRYDASYSYSYSSYSYWRSFVALCAPTSVAEWLLLVWVWNKLLCPGLSPPPPSWQLSWPVVYCLSAVTGQLWMLAFELGCRQQDNYDDWQQQQQQQQQQQEQQQQQQMLAELPALSGCAGWATAGVLCAVGIRIPRQRFACFLAASALVVLHQCQATGSSVGCSGAAFFGWALAGIHSSSSSSSRQSRSTSRSPSRIYAYSRDYSLPDLEAWREIPSSPGERERRKPWDAWNGIAFGVAMLLWFLPMIFVVYR